MEPNRTKVSVPTAPYRNPAELNDEGLLKVQLHVYVSRRTGEVVRMLTQDLEHIVPAGGFNAYAWQNEDTGRQEFFMNFDVLAKDEWEQGVRDVS